MPYVGEIRMFAGNFAPAGWAFCDGAPLPISENETLFVIIGTTYGGNGETEFNLPDLRGRLPIHQGNGHVLGENAGVEEVTLTTQQIPAHTHAFVVNTAAGNATSPQSNLPAASATIDLYRETSPAAPLNANAAGPVGGSQPHTNFQPYVCINFILSLFGVYPSET